MTIAVGCGDDKDDDDTATDTGTANTVEPVSCEGTDTVVTFETEDGETLEADYRQAETGGLGAVVLIHMIPPNDRSGYPKRVRNKFAEVGLSVLNVDRRGAGQSTGNPDESYLGPGGRFDVEAAVRFLTSDDRGCPVDPAKISLVGASNGTTSVFDYAVERDSALPEPASMVWMSPGTYTENQASVADNRTIVDEIPILWLYPTTEPWSADFIAGAADGWEFTERGGEHGTNMFDGDTLEDDTVADMVAWLESLSG